MTVCRAEDVWLAGLPKVENHVHLEGCIPPEILNAAAERQNIAAPVAEFTDLDGFLRILDAQCALLTAAGDLHDVARARVHTAAANNIGHTDLIINTAHWPSWTGQLDRMLDALDAGFRAGEADFASANTTTGSALGQAAPTTNLSLSIGRHQSALEADVIVDVVVSGKHPRVTGISIDGNEAAPGAGSQRFAAALKRVRRNGKHVAVHTGESGGPEHIRASLDDLQPHRIDHGIRSVEDPSLVRRLASERIPLAVCLTSNIRLGVVADIRNHPIVALLAAGVPVSLNTDDPTLLGTSLNAEYQLAADTFAWTRNDFERLARNAIQTATVSPERRATLTADLDRYLDATNTASEQYPPTSPAMMPCPK